ncbi:hypothetical protein BJV78DRAFT_1360075 [Lactifluus subvellereus]|nr:hypothetical protein BJV78DRAFT_1360075 [Lactifluus subvellereus]
MWHTEAFNVGLRCRTKARRLLLPTSITWPTDASRCSAMSFQHQKKPLWSLKPQALLRLRSPQSHQKSVCHTVQVLVSQRRRWLNGLSFAALHSTVKFHYIYCSSHTFARKSSVLAILGFPQTTSTRAASPVKCTEFDSVSDFPEDDGLSTSSEPQPRSCTNVTRPSFSPIYTFSLQRPSPPSPPPSPSPFPVVARTFALPFSRVLSQRTWESQCYAGPSVARPA